MNSCSYRTCLITNRMPPLQAFLNMYFLVPVMLLISFYHSLSAAEKEVNSFVSESGTHMDST